MLSPACYRLMFVALLVVSAHAAYGQTVFPAADWQVAEPESQSMTAEGVAKIGQWLKDNGSKTGLVVRHGRIVGEWYFDGATAQSKLIVYSTTKSVSSTAVGVAIDQGKLKLDTKLGEYFPEAMPAQKREITIQQLLSMTSGAHNDNSQLSRSDLFPYVLNELPMDHAPGTKWEYNNTGLALLSPLFSKATGQNIDQYLNDNVFTKIGIPRDDWSWEDRDGMPLPYSGLHITARSLARFGLLFLNKGMWRGNKVVSSTWVTEATNAQQDLNKRYGYLWWNNSTGAWSKVPADAYAAMGKYDNDMLVVPSLDMIVIRQVGNDEAAKRQVKIDELFALAAAAVTDPSPWQAVPETPSNVEVARAFPNLRIERPILVTGAGDGTNRLFVPSQLGTVYVLPPNDPNVEEPAVFLDISDRVVYEDKENEKGFLGMAFHPKYKQNGQFFVYYTPKGLKPHTVAVSRFRVSKNDPNKADPNSEERLLEVEHPFWNHKGGTIAFGPDGYLYIAIGDGGFRDDPKGNGQNLNTHLAKILRIDVDHADPGRKYAIPKDNPFAGQADKKGEIWAYGLRNPWRIAFDRATGTLWCADVGQDLWEEIDLITKGGNYGWRLREGVHRFGPNGSAPRKDLIEPIWEYHHDVGKSITGGFVYRGKRLPQLDGCYLYADYVTGKVWALKYDEAAKKVVANYTISGNVSPIMTFGEDDQAEAYYTTDGGLIYTLQEKK